MGGCLPMVIQIPVFFALYRALSAAIELRHAPFMFWINDLSSPEDLFTLHVAGYDLPLRILPLIMGVTQVMQQKMTPTSVDPMQEKMMLAMPVVFTFIFWGFPSGLVLYWLVNNVISIAQQYYINKKVS
jgi:YidC/Oxa1 family membrane protein insertase